MTMMIFFVRKFTKQESPWILFCIMLVPFDDGLVWDLGIVSICIVVLDCSIGLRKCRLSFVRTYSSPENTLHYRKYIEVVQERKYIPDSILLLEYWQNAGLLMITSNNYLHSETSKSAFLKICWNSPNQLCNIQNFVEFHFAQRQALMSHIWQRLRNGKMLKCIKKRYVFPLAINMCYPFYIC